MISKIKKTMQEHDMLPKSSVLVALSGGADSVALLHVMYTLSQQCGFKVYAAHVNHNLRGDDALRDEQFSKQLCQSLDIECFVKNANVRDVAQELGISEEMAGRRVRYDFFGELMNTYHIEFTATAHHKNDNAETIIMNFIRGSALSGLSGIPYKRDNYIRPMLNVSRAEIEAYCKENELGYVTDATNLDTVYTRNKIRNILIPKIEAELNPNFVDTVTSNSDIIREDDDFINRIAENEYNNSVRDNAVRVTTVLSWHRAISSRVIRKIIDNVCGITDISSAVIDAVYNICKSGKTGQMCDITRDISARIEYDRLVIGKTPGECAEFAYIIGIGESVYIPELGYRVTVERACECNNEWAEFFSLGDGVKELTVTNRRPGDRFNPSGMKGTKSVKEYMINEKIPKPMRSRTGIMRIGNDIAWVIGYRRDGRFFGKDIAVTITDK